MGLEVLAAVLAIVVVVVLVVGYIVVRLARLLHITWKRKTKKIGPAHITWAGPRLVSLYFDLWLWKGQLYPRKRKARR